MAGSVTDTTTIKSGVKKHSLAWTSDASGNVTGNSSYYMAGRITRIVIKPGSTTPSDGYDLALNDSDSVDILQGLGGDLSSSSNLEINMGNRLWVETTSDEELYQTNLYSGSDADVNNTRKYTSDIALDRVNQQVSIDIKFTGSGSTDDLKVSIFKQRGGGWDGDEIAIFADTVQSDGSEDLYSLLIDINDYGMGHFRLGLESTGGTDTFDLDAECRYYRPWDFQGIQVEGILTPAISNAGNAKTGTIILYLGDQ